jgi:hypothetical protein
MQGDTKIFTEMRWKRLEAEFAGSLISKMIGLNTYVIHGDAEEC